MHLHSAPVCVETTADVQTRFMTTLHWEWRVTRIAGGEAVDDDGEREGPAWLAEADGTARQINSGHWMTRGAAERLAAKHGHVFCPKEDPL